MESTFEADPFLWDEERLVQELCTSNRTWDAPAPHRLPDPATLASQLRQHEIDGEILLTYEDIWGSGIFLHAFLETRLGIKKIRHQMSVKDAVRSFQARSASYKQWKKERNGGDTTNEAPIDRKQLPVEHLSNDPPAGPGGSAPVQPSFVANAAPKENSPALSHTPSHTAFVAAIDSPSTDVSHDKQNTAGSNHTATSADEISISDPAAPQGPSPSHGAALPTNKKTDESVPETAVGPEAATDEPRGPPIKKQKRIMPTNISSVPSHLNPGVIPTEADGIAAFAKPKPSKTFAGPALDGTPEYFLRQQHSVSAYLGTATMLPGLLTKPQTGPVDGTRNFVLVRTKRIPPGRQIQVHQIVKKYLLPGPLSVRRQSSEDEILPLFGDSDEELDEETMRQIAKDDAEDLRIAARKQASTKLPLSPADVRAIVDSSLQSMIEQWASDKEPRLRRKANKIWNDARRHNLRRSQIHSAKQRENHYDGRIQNLIDQICREQWFKKIDIERQCIALEQTIQDREHDRWLIRTLSRHTPPPQLPALPRPSRLAEKKYVRLEDDEEILSSEMDSDSFIDDPEESIASDPSLEMDIDDPPGADVAVGSETYPSTSEESHSDPMLVDLPEDTASSNEPMQWDGRSPVQLDSMTPPLLPPSPAPPSPVPPSPVPPSPKAIEINEVIDITASPASPASLSDSGPPPEYHDVAAISELGAEHWATEKDSRRLVIAALQSWKPDRRHRLFDAVKSQPPQDSWDYLILRVEATGMSDILDRRDANSALKRSLGYDMGKLFDAFISCSAQRLHRREFKQATINRMRENRARFDDFHTFLVDIVPYFAPPDGTAAREPDGLRRSITRPEGILKLGDSRNEGRSGGVVEDSKTKLPEEENAEIQTDDSDEDMPDTTSPGNKRRRNRKLNLEAQNIRRTIFRRREEQEERRRILNERIAQSGVISGDKSRLIINVAKEEHQSLIYVHEHIGSRIKDHQIEGVRFLWNQIVLDSQVRQGCLLAHTMGLGKTMQVVTMLVAVAEAAASVDASIRSQVPEELRESKTLVLCPSGLVDNWLDELLLWVPGEVLGSLFAMTSQVPPADRSPMIHVWAANGGVMVIGYPMYRELAKDDELSALLREKPNIVIGDEAHILKNPDSQISRATQDFRTTSRIALTGSPLTNHVTDYYAMINWIAPNYLADINEFRCEYANPIKEGFYADSHVSARRQALKLLKVLKETVAPKVHRMGISTLKGELPAKREFIISVPLTELQIKAYKVYLSGVRDDPTVSALLTGQAKVWSLVNHLGSLVAHPSIFRKHMEAQKQRAEQRSKDTEEETILPTQFISDLLATVRWREIEDLKFSWKIRTLVRILAESKRLGDKVLVFSQSLRTLDFLQKIFSQLQIRYSRLDGKTNIADRQGAVKNFNSADGADVYLISTRAGGVGLNIYGANRVVIFDFRYTPTEEQQAVGRAYRIGQTKPVYVYWLIAGGTFEDTIHNKSIFKMQLASRVVDKKNPVAWGKRHGQQYLADPQIPERLDLGGYLGQDDVLDALIRCEELQGALLKITSTDTFEEEQEEALTDQEKKEADDMIEANRLRNQDPDEYQRQEREKLAALQPLPSLHSLPTQVYHQRPGPISQPAPAGIPATPALPKPSSQPKRAIPLGVPESTRTQGPHPSPSSGTGAPAAVLPLSQSHLNHLSAQTPHPPAGSQPPKSFGKFHSQPPAASSSSQSESQARGGQAPAQGPLGPVFGTGTHSRPAVQPQASPQRPSGQHPMDAFTQDKGAKLVETLQPIYLEMKQSNLLPAGDPKGFVSRFARALDREKKDTMEKMDALVALKSTIQKCRRLGNAILSGYLQPAWLAPRNRRDIEAIAATFEGQDEADFLHMLQNPAGGPDVCNTPHQLTQQHFQTH